MLDGVQTCAVRLVAPTMRTSRMMRRLSSLSMKARQESSESNSMVTITCGVLSIGLRKVRNSATPGWLRTVGIQSLRALFAYTRRFSRWVGKSHVITKRTIGLRILSSTGSRSLTPRAARPSGRGGAVSVYAVLPAAASRAATGLARRARGAAAPGRPGAAARPIRPRVRPGLAAARQPAAGGVLLGVLPALG